MYFSKFLSRYFEIEESIVFSDEDVEKKNNLTRFELYDKGNDSEYIFSLTMVSNNLEDRIAGTTPYKIGNIYSSLEHGVIMGEDEIRKIILSKKYIKK